MFAHVAANHADELRASVCTIARATGWFIALTALMSATPSRADPFSQTLYVGIDHAEHTAFVYDANFSKLPVSPNSEKTSIVQIDSPRWLLGFHVDVVKRQTDNKGISKIKVVSHRPAYYEMIHHLVLTYVSSRPDVDKCTNRPIAAGSELSDISYPTGYAYWMPDGALVPSSWHFENPRGIAHHEQVYLRLIMLFDDQRGGYRDVHATWVETDRFEPCHNEFAIPPGHSDFEGPPLTAEQDMRLVAAYTHTHDHVKFIELRHNGSTLRRFEPDYARAAAAHDDVGEGETPLHVHDGHLPPQGLHGWMPGAYGPIIRKGDTLSTYAQFDNPHDHAIDNMVLFPLLWEEVRK